MNGGDRERERERRFGSIDWLMGEIGIKNHSLLPGQERARRAGLGFHALTSRSPIFAFRSEKKKLPSLH